MCGRYAVTSAPEAIRALFGYPEQPNFPLRYNVAPTQPIAIVRLMDGKRQFALVRWGLLPSRVKDPQGFHFGHQCAWRVGHRQTGFQRGDEAAALPRTGRRILRVEGNRGRQTTTYARSPANRWHLPGCGRPGPVPMAEKWKRRQS
jgi:putative SOS response-associated peptidase YedK